MRNPTRRKTAWREGDAYTLPLGWTWADIVRLRAERGIREHFVPIAFGPRCVGWGAFIPQDSIRMRLERLLYPRPGRRVA